MHWTVHLEGGPRRVNHAAVAVGNRIFCFGGYCTGDNYKDRNTPIDGFVLNTETYRWYGLPQLPRPTTPGEDVVWPYQRYGHTVSAYGDSILLFGGRNDENPCNVLYVFDTRTLTWSRPAVTGTVPPERDGHSTCIINDALYVFGGYEESHHRFGEDVYRLCLKTMVWTLLDIEGEKPVYRDFHTATAIGDCMYVFGGRSDHQWGHLLPAHAHMEYYTNKLSFLDTKTNTWHTPDTNPAPQGRRSHSAICLDNKLLIFGGFNGALQEHMNDLWLYDPIVNVWKQLHPRGVPPIKRRRHCMCQVGDKLFVFGGTSPYNGPPLYFTPEQMELIPEVDTSPVDGPAVTLIDHNDLHVLDLNPSLRTLAAKKIIAEGIDTSELPRNVKEDIKYMTMGNTISKPLPLAPLPLG